MLLMTKEGRAMLSPGDIDPKAAAEMLANGSATEVKAIRLSRDARFAGVDFSGSFDAGSVVELGRDVPEHIAKTFLNPVDAVHPFHAVNPHTVIAAEQPKPAAAE